MTIRTMMSADKDSGASRRYTFIVIPPLPEVIRSDPDVNLLK